MDGRSCALDDRRNIFGKRQIDKLRTFHRQAASGGVLRRLFRRPRKDHAHYLVKLLPHPRDIESRYRKNEFQFYPTGGGGELTDDFYGETWIPERWMAQRSRELGFRKCDFFREFGRVDQCVFVLTR